MRISDPKAIRALAHPLRLDLLEFLAVTSPATAAHCGRVLGASQASCSFHLRQLAKYGFVEDAGPGEDRRERQWRVPSGVSSVHIGGLPGRELERLVVEREMQAIVAQLDRGESANIVSAIVAIKPEEAAELRKKFKKLLEPYVARGSESDQQYVRCFFAATPITESEHVA